MAHTSHHLEATTGTCINEKVGRLIRLQFLQRQKGRRRGGDGTNIIHARAMYLVLAVGNDSKMTIVMFAAEGAEGSFGWEEGDIRLEIKMVDKWAGFSLHCYCNDYVGDGHNLGFLGMIRTLVWFIWCGRVGWVVVGEAWREAVFSAILISLFGGRQKEDTHVRHSLPPPLFPCLLPRLFHMRVQGGDGWQEKKDRNFSVVPSFFVYASVVGPKYVVSSQWGFAARVSIHNLFHCNHGK
jgi:hypothetical protein